MRRLAKIEIENIKGVAAITIECGAVTVISGANGAGKSSVLDAVSSIFEGGHDPGLLRNGCESGKVVLTLDDGTIISKVVTEKGSKLEVTTPDGGIVKGPKTFVEKLAASFAFDPIELVDAPAKERAAVLLKALPIDFTTDEVAEAIGGAPVQGVKIPLSSIGLEQLDGLHDAIYSQRRSLNVAVRDLDGMIRNMKTSLPDEDGENLDAQIVDLEFKLSALKQERAAGAAKLRADKTQLIADAERLYRDTVANIEKEYAETLTAATEAIDAEIKILGEAFAVANERYDRRLAAQGLKRSIEEQEKALKGHVSSEMALTAALERIKALKVSKLANLPIDGLDIRDGEIFLDGVAWDHVNTAKKYAVCCQIGALLAGDLPLIVMDRAETIDDEYWEQLSAAFKEAGLQVIAARVTEGELVAQ